MSRRPALLCLAGLLALMPVAAHAAETLLRLSETATVTVPPDELAGSVRAEATSSSAAEAQNRVNTLIRDALATARAESGITVSTGGYQVWRGPNGANGQPGPWQASQSLQLSSHDGVKLLGLVGQLQQKGLVTSGLSWRLSREAERAAHQDALKKALAALEGRVQEAAALIGLRFDHFKEVRLDVPHQQPMPMLRASAAVAVAPSAVADDVPVSATADADAILVPR